MTSLWAIIFLFGDFLRDWSDQLVVSPVASWMTPPYQHLIMNHFLYHSDSPKISRNSCPSPSVGQRSSYGYLVTSSTIQYILPLAYSDTHRESRYLKSLASFTRTDSATMISGKAMLFYGKTVMKFESSTSTVWRNTNAQWTMICRTSGVLLRWWSGNMWWDNASRRWDALLDMG